MMKYFFLRWIDSWPLAVKLFVGRKLPPCDRSNRVSDINWFLFPLWALGGEDNLQPWRPSFSSLLWYEFSYLFLYSSLLWWPVLISSSNQANLICWMKKYFPTELLHSLRWLVCLQLLHSCHLLTAVSPSLYFFKLQRSICFSIYSLMTFTVWYWRIGW